MVCCFQEVIRPLLTSNIIQQNEEEGEYTDTLLSNHHDKFPHMQQLDREEREPGAIGTCSMRKVVPGVDTRLQGLPTIQFVCTNGRGRSGSFHHVNDLRRQKGGSSPRP